MRRELMIPAMTAVLFLALHAAGCGGGKYAQSPLHSSSTNNRPFRPAEGERWSSKAICYGAHRDGQRPGGPSPSAAELKEDLQLMLPHWNMLRLYGSSGFAETLLELIRADDLDMKVMLGVWIDAEQGPDPAGEVDPAIAAANKREVEAAIRLAGAYPEIVNAVCVGNETQVSWSGHRSPPEVLVRYLRQVRSRVSVPVTTADDIDFWIEPESRVIAKELDFITFHAHPMWHGRLLDEAMPWMEDQLAAMRDIHPGSNLVLGETGWATSVDDQGEQAELIKGKPGESEQKIFYDRVCAWAESEKLSVYVFEAFDENWKGGSHPAEVEKHWGLFNADRSPKQALATNEP